MSEIAKRIRQKRFTIRENSEVTLVLETPTGDKLKTRIMNISMSGVSIQVPIVLSEEDGMTPGSIMPAAKITFESHEYTLGRLVLRSINSDGTNTTLGLSAIDSKLPMDSALSHFFEEGLDETDSLFDYELDPEKFTIANFATSENTNVDLFAKVQKFSVFFKQWEKTPKYSYHNIRQPSMGTRVALDRKRRNGRSDYIIMGSNDYLGLSSHPHVREAAKNAIDQYGVGSTGSPVTSGITALHEELSHFLSRMLKKEKVVLFNSGYTANVGLINALVQPNDLVIADMISHASIHDAMQMCRGTSRFFKHNDVAHLEKGLQEARRNHAGALVVTEGVFSMDGDVAPLDKIVATARKHKSRIMVDEAHSFGVVGPSGLGACEKYDVMSQVDVVMGTFSKICGGIGGFVATTEDVANWIYVFARAHLFTVSMAPASAAAALKALQIFSENRELVTSLHRNIKHFTDGLRYLGYNIKPDHESAVIPVIIGDEAKLGIMNQVFMDAGVFVVPIIYPGVSRTSCRFRFTVMATHSTSDLDYVLNVLELAMQKADFKFSPTAPKNVASAA